DYYCLSYDSSLRGYIF
nr:immunoglobulin light chain junction region [Macaca mulatta]MOW04176.1 immunoglobulin light chain junction region [Macaca mulatta]MOW04993.1 immunoglobulin light chain junction region [Macaca mulatta]MOW05733.1 immunoglobulin light chain junction region [Macaca mulatta]MOW05811.1 immunoglobulin light chain junction region [Macaca mulatta]